MPLDRGSSDASLAPAGRIILVALGSGGDVYPLVALGRALRARGHEVVMATTDIFAEVVREACLHHVQIGDERSSQSAEDDPNLWKFPDGVKILFGRLLDAVPDTYKLIAERYEPGRTVVAANFLCFGARVAQEKLGVPLATVHYQPVMLRSLNVQPGRVIDARWRPVVRPLRRLATYLMDRHVFDPVLSPRLNEFRAGLGLRAEQRWMRSWIQSPDLVLGLFPEWFAERQPDWPPNLTLTGFPLADAAAQPELEPEVAEFLDAGEPPVVFTFGTAMAFGREFFEVSADICRQLGRRGLLLSRYDDQIPLNQPEGVRRFAYAPLTRLLPRAAALVHHGGVGTMAQALAAGCPQLITPLNFDQPDNAARVEAMGVGLRLKPKEYKGDAAVAAVRRLLESPQIRERNREVASRFVGQDPLGAACEAVEGLLRR